jgi:rhodanese-related sulfurtransferase
MHTMPEQLIPFISHHWPLVSAFILLFLLVIINEYWSQHSGPKKLSTTTAVFEMNHHGALIIDIRAKTAFQQAHILGAISIPSDDPEKFKRYQSSPLILVCDRGVQSTTLANKLIKLGFAKVMLLEGGIQAWLAANLPLVKK